MKHFINEDLSNALSTTYEACALAAIKEQWAEFFSDLDEELIPCEDANEKCAILIDDLEEAFKKERFIKYPHHLV